MNCDDEDSFDRLISQPNVIKQIFGNNDLENFPKVYTTLKNVVSDSSGQSKSYEVYTGQTALSEKFTPSTSSGLSLQENVWYGHRVINPESDSSNDANENCVRDEDYHQDLYVKPNYEEETTSNINVNTNADNATTDLENNPPRKKSRRKRPETWKMNIRKTRRNIGQKYVNSLGKLQEAKIPKFCDCEKCPYKCSKSIGDEGTLQLFKDFWNLGEYSRQSDYIAARVKRLTCKRQRVEGSRRKCSFSYEFYLNEKKITVCKKFFLSTLSISEKRVRVVMEKLRRSETRTTSPDRRGKHEPGIKTSSNRMKLVNEHIDKFPRVPSHYSRRDSSKVYLETMLNKEIMYKLYVEYCKERGEKPICKTKYKDTLLDRKIAFHIPKKDACWCVEFYKKVGEEREKREEEFVLHTRRKEFANEEKKRDAERTRQEKSFLSANFDLEAVLYCPLFFSKPLFYKRKYALFNFTIYDVQQKQGHCYTWEEIEGKRGSNEIATCLYKFLESISSDIKEVSFFSDCCSGQNRNSIVATAMMHMIQNHPTLNSINLKFLEPGHTHMECDSIHATIENASRYVKIFVPNDWHNVIKLAKKNGPPYKLTILKHNDFTDFKHFKDNHYKNFNTSTDDSILNWKTVRWLRFEKERPTIILYKNEMWEDFHELDTKYLKRTNRKKTIHEYSANLLDYRAYKSVLPISKKKYKDLCDLCQNDVIENLYKPFYLQLGKKLDEDGSGFTDSDDDLALSEMREKMRKRKRI